MPFPLSARPIFRGPFCASGLLTLLAFTGVACAKTPIRPDQVLIEDLRFQGNSKGLFRPDGAGVLADVVDTRATGRLIDIGKIDFGPIVGDPGVLDVDALAEDSQRLVTWYAHHGWFDAKFLEWKQIPRKRERTPTGALRIDLVGVIEPGAPSVLAADIELVGIEGLSTPIANGVRKLARLKAGDAFDLDDYEGTITSIRDRLRERGYAYATVKGKVTVRPDQHSVHIRIEVEPGRACVFGGITIKGRGPIDEARLLQELNFKAGDGFRTSKLAAARQRLYALGVYALVELTPVLTTPELREVPIEIRLQRRPSRTLKFGPSLEIDTTRQTLAATVEYRDDDVFHKLWRWQSKATAGVATQLDPTQEMTFGEQFLSTVAPVASVEQTFTFPGLLGGKFAAVGSGAAALGIESGYREFEASVSPALQWTPDRRIVTSSGYRLKYHRSFDRDAREAIQESDLDVSIAAVTLISSLEQSLTWDARDDKLAPTRNYLFSVSLAEAGGFLGGDQDFFRVRAEARSYRSIRFGEAEPSTVVAGRIGGGLIAPYKAAGAIDIDERLFLGGGNTVRGWGENRLSPYVQYAVCADGSDECAKKDQVQTVDPVGGNVMTFGSVEIRQALPWSLGVVVFVDAGRAWDEFVNVAFNDLQYSLGGGLRYGTPIGPIRLDAGFVLNAARTFREQPGWPGWALHFGLGEAF